MIEMNPADRKTAEIYLSQAQGKVFPEYFYSFLQPYMFIFSAAPILSPDEKISRIKKDITYIINNLRTEEQQHKNGGCSIKPNKEENIVVEVDDGLNKLETKDEEENKEEDQKIDGKTKKDVVDGLVIITQLVTSCVRGLHHSQSKLQSLEILLELAENVSDETILDRILPYIVISLNGFEI